MDGCMYGQMAWQMERENEGWKKNEEKKKTKKFGKKEECIQIKVERRKDGWKTQKEG